MKYVYLVFTKGDDERVTIAGAYTSQRKAWDTKEELAKDGTFVSCEKVPLNEDSYILLNVWSSRK
ncbi:hypothetical protein PQE70_gp040 [Bacillus phage vB_BanS_Nate]|uniref:Uncharacterized protein n=1 Tax=Bacillus phage vB_BanS_Nate TaxID=2894788 RepID=A0AAE8YU78_9CAUD|nr:hypothetical protein PQE70_gp040 [Bacillus phage vB_BanS_Nate]UGO50893.1 hypothetical protein NATE_40 [Bacillus phage vB_BanS_Nate]